MGRLRELINVFINPIPPEKSLDELAAEAKIDEADLKLLKNSMGGVKNFKFADETEEPKKGKNTRAALNKENQVQTEQKPVVIEEKVVNNGEERD